MKRQQVFHWKSGMSNKDKWDNTNELNEKLEAGWIIAGCIQPSAVIDPGEPVGGNAVYRSVLVILEKEAT